MSQNIVVNGTTYYNVPAVVFQDENGNDVRFDINDNMSFFGDDCAFYKNVWSSNITLHSIEGTQYSAWSEWTASTTNNVFIASETAGTETLDLTSYDYIVELAFDVSVAHSSSATLKATPIRQFGRYYYVIQRGHTNISKYTANTPNYNYVRTLYTSAVYCVYYNSSGTSGVIGYTSAYGLACATAAPTISDTSASNAVLTMNTPDFHARCSSTYFATSRKTGVDENDTTIKRKVNLYRTKPNASVISKIYNRSLDIWNNSI